ncbi:MAG: sulfopyruvate decarboxylase subunit alpha [Chloroflexi bacterium]|nr:sulfopyruvate decarboxylase subunit alpha [Chloroflexota bacterium]
MDALAAKTILEGLKEAGIDFVATLPEANLQPLISAVDAEQSMIHVPLAREEEGIGVCTGAYLAGKKPAMVMMDAGFLTCCNALVTLNYLSGIPLLMLVGYSGGISEKYWMHTQLGVYTEPVLKAMDVVYEVATKLSDVKSQIQDAQTWTSISKRPVAVVLNKECLR